jgi:hypothetical protein
MLSAVARPIKSMRGVSCGISHRKRVSGQADTGPKPFGHKGSSQLPLLRATIIEQGSAIRQNDVIGNTQFAVKPAGDPVQPGRTSPVR